MNDNPPKKQPATVTGDPQDIELEQQIRERAYELYEARGRQTATNRKIGSARKRSSRSRNSAPPPPDLCTHSQPESEASPGPLRGLFMYAAPPSFESPT